MADKFEYKGYSVSVIEEYNKNIWAKDKYIIGTIEKDKKAYSIKHKVSSIKYTDRNGWINREEPDYEAAYFEMKSILKGIIDGIETFKDPAPEPKVIIVKEELK